MNGLPKREDFEPHLNSVFEARPAGMEPLTLRLVAVEDRSTDEQESFSLLFEGEKERVFRHDTCTLAHPAMGEISLFLGPVHTGRTDAVCYQAVFNTLKRRFT